MPVIPTLGGRGRRIERSRSSFGNSEFEASLGYRRPCPKPKPKPVVMENKFMYIINVQQKHRDLKWL